MNRRSDLKTRRDFQVLDVDVRGNPRSLAVIPDPEPAPIVEAQAVQLPTRPAATARTAATVTGSYQDRAKGFSHVTLNLALVTGLAVLTAAVFVKGSAITLAGTLGFFMLGFFVVWAGAYILHVFVSPEGVEFFEVWQYWRMIHKEQAERHRRYKEMGGGEE